MEVSGFILSIIALVVAAVALPTVFQMFWGAPLVSVATEEFTNNSSRLLLCTVLNAPVKSRILRAMRVARQAAQVHAAFRIKRSDGTQVSDTINAKFVDDNFEENYSIVLAPPYKNGFTVALHAEKSGVPDYRNNKEIELAPGDYSAEIIVHVGEELIARKFRFTIGAERAQTHWDQSASPAISSSVHT